MPNAAARSAVAYSGLYRLLSHLPGIRHSFRAKVLLVAFVGTHVPLLALIAFYLQQGAVADAEALLVLGLALVATLVGTGLTVAVLAALLGPVKAIQGMLSNYRERGELPGASVDAPPDEVGALAAGTARTLTELDEHLRDAAHRDPASGALNANGFSAALAERLADGERRTVALVELPDLERWQVALDRAGTDFIAAVLVDRLRFEAGSEAVIGVLGRGRFGIVLPDATDDREARLDALLGALARPIEVRGHRLVGEPLMGVATAAPGEGADRVMSAAEAALLAAGQGSGPARVDAAEGGESVRERLALALELDEALRTGQLYPVYQARMNAAGSKVAAFEALVRWRHPGRGEIGPGRFIPTAEQSERIVEIGRQMLDAAVAQAAAWGREGHNVPVSVNLAARQIASGDLEQQVRDALRRHDLPPERLELEVTEGTLLSDLDASARALEALRHLGVRIALDDFGTGYSSLSYLGRLPLDRVKLDRSFVERSAEPQDRRVIAGVVELAGGLGLPVTAEGIETPEEAERLRDLGCDELQGFLYARPVMAKHINWAEAPAHAE